MSYSSIGEVSRLEIFTIIEACLSYQPGNDFEDILNITREIIGQEMTACGIGVGSAHAMRQVSSLNVGFPDEFISTIVDSSGGVTSPLFCRWLKSQSLQTLDLDNPSNNYSFDEIEFYQKFSLRNVVAHGVMDYGQRYTSYFGFANLPRGIETSHIAFVETLVPHLHIAYSKSSSLKKDLISVSSGNITTHDGMKRLLSPREHEVLRWLSDGKSNWDIGNILNISEYTVKTHVQRIIKKLNANNRQHAVAKALELELIYL